MTRQRSIPEKAKAHGASYPNLVYQEAKRISLQVSLGYALIEQESGSSGNVWGHDREPNGGTTSLGGKPVTEANYRAYKNRRGSRGQGGMQGIGPAQLTYWSIQDHADKLGGCHRPRINIRVGFENLAGLIKQHGERKALAVYNGGAGNPNFAYADQVLARKRKWHDRLS